MRRLQRLNLNANLSISSSDDNGDDDEHTDKGKIANNNKKKNNCENDPILIPTIASAIQPTSISYIDEINNRIALLPAYPSFNQSNETNIQDHLLLANVSRQLLTNEQRRRYQERDNFQSSFQIIDQTNNNAHNTFSSFFYTTYRKLFINLTRRLHINDAIIDYNYQRLFKCFDIMTNERIYYDLQKHPLTNGDVLPIHEYAIALEFFLQIDRNVFFMKTCSFRGALNCLSNRFNGIFCLEPPYASYGITACQESYCHFCFPPPNVPNRTRQYQPVIQFSSRQKHTFVSGYQSILNCPATCRTRNILYVLTCPCGEYDYIGYTSMTLDQRLAYHREHGNRIIHEFIFGSKNILRVDSQPKAHETLVKDDMLLYKHSARCPAAAQLFLDSNPHYWSFIPMLQNEAQNDNQFYKVPNSIPMDPSSLLITSADVRSDNEAGCCMTDLPPLPSNKYTFSTRQCAEQFQYFKNKQDYRWPNFNLDLYNATILAVLPDNCSTPLYRLLEALFITHAQTKLNTIGHLDRIIVPGINMNNNQSKIDIVTDRGDWCHNLCNRPLPHSQS